MQRWGLQLWVGGAAETNSPHSCPLMGKEGTTQPMVKTNPKLSITTLCRPLRRRWAMAEITRSTPYSS